MSEFDPQPKDDLSGRAQFSAAVRPMLDQQLEHAVAYGFWISPSITVNDPVGFGDAIFLEMHHSGQFNPSVTPIVGPTIGAETTGRIIKGRQPRLVESTVPPYLTVDPNEERKLYLKPFKESPEAIRRSLAYAIWALVGHNTVDLKMHDEQLPMDRSVFFVSPARATRGYRAR
jgi:hypothetical protein